MPLQTFGEWVSGNLGAAYLGLFAVLAMTEILFAQRLQPGSASPRRALVNFGMAALGLVLAALLPVSVISAAQLAERAQLGLFQQVAAPSLLILLATLITRTGLAYGLHRLSHTLPLLWRLHRCHHSDPHVDLSLALRHHPLELLPGMLVFPAGTVALGAPLWAVAVVELLLIFGSLSEHVALTLPAGVNRGLGLVFVTPAIHRIHHSADQPQTDSNFGNLLTLWDRMFGTFRDPDTSPVARIGLGDADDRLADNLAAQLLLPFARNTRPAVALGRRAR